MLEVTPKDRDWISGPAGITTQPRGNSPLRPMLARWHDVKVDVLVAFGKARRKIRLGLYYEEEACEAGDFYYVKVARIAHGPG